MKRLLQIGSGLFVFSIMPIIAWFLLGITLGNPDIINVFSLTYPIQFIWLVFTSIFATGANIKRYKENDENCVYSSLVIGIVLGAIVFGVITIFIEPYIKFMNMDVETYKDFSIYSVVSLYIQLIFSFILEKLYFEDKEKIANIHSWIFNLLNSVVLVGLSLFTKNTSIIIIATLAVITLYVIGLLIWQFKKFKFSFNILNNFKYESLSIITNTFMFIIYLFGFSNAFEFGEKYILAINFVTLITDAQWDALVAIKTSAKIDISKGDYNYKKSIRNSFYFVIICIISSLIMFVSLFDLYDVNLTIALIMLSIQIIDYLLFVFTANLESFLQLNYSPIINTINGMLSTITRTLISIFILSPYCTEIGQITGTLVLLGLCFSKRFGHFMLTKEGYLVSNSPFRFTYNVVADRAVILSRKSVFKKLHITKHH